VLAEGRGLIVPFESDSALAGAVLRFVNDRELLTTTRRQAYQYAQSMFWPNVGQQYLDTFEQAIKKTEPTFRPPTIIPTKVGTDALATSLRRK